MTIRLLIADDHPLFREGMRGRLDRVADIAVVGEAASGDEAVELAHQLGPHVILMDIKMPGLNGIEATREIQKASPQMGVLVLTMFEDDVLFANGATEDFFHELTVGVNYYIQGHAAKFTLDASYVPNGSPNNQTGLGILAGDDAEFVFRGQFQLLL